MKFDGDLIIAAKDIGADGYYIHDSIECSGSICTEGGFTLRVRKGIKAGAGIDAGWGIKAGAGIEAGTGIKAGGGIEAGWGIKAGGGIEAGWGIKAGGGIEAGEGIEAGLTIVAKWITTPLRIFAGLCIWKIPSDCEMEIRAEVRNGTVAYGRAVAPEVRGIP